MLHPTETASVRITLRCANCQVKLRAPRELAGRTCPCPRCKQPVLVRAHLPSDADIALVPDPRWA